MQKIEHNSLCETETYKGMTDNDIKIISEKIDSLQKKILKSKFAEKVTESEMVSLILAVQELNRQKAEIERLKNAYKQCAWERDTFQSEVDVLKNKCEDCAGCSEWKCDCSNIRNQAIEEFAERLKDTYKNHLVCSFNVLNNDIDNLVKEMVGENP